ncbi:MAG: hypothetical protein DRJ05_12365 [Bacteroidetes bacterium]|nr:MAG: hypothetical protein DRJ05_12365 [Bacteroidota bacterium]
MKNKDYYIAVIGIFSILIFGGRTVFSQGEIISVNPPSSFQGETIHLIIQGTGTGFVQGETEVVFDESVGVTLISTLINNPELITVQIKIAANAPAGDCFFSIITNTQIYKPSFEIIALAGDPEAMITVFPVQSIYLSDYDFSNLQNLPLLFTISVFNSGENIIKVKVELKHNDYGMVAAADKKLEFDNSVKIITFDNREFDNYDEDIAAEEILENAIGNGTIPPGEYVYYVYLYDEDNNLIGEKIMSEFYISGSISGIDMIAPGTPLDSDPVMVFENTPYFQWFGGLAEYNFTLYEVLEEQKAADEIISNIPVYQEKGLTTASYLYPNFAETLEPGKTYAWQITSNILTSSGSQEITGDVYWFIYQKGNISKRELEEIRIYPDDIDLMPGDSVQIKVEGFDINGDTLKVDCNWNVIPKDMGKVDKNGWFIAGDKPGTVAVSTLCGAKEDYITINILKDKR